MGMVLKPITDREPIIKVHRDWSYAERYMLGGGLFVYHHDSFTLD